MTFLGGVRGWYNMGAMSALLPYASGFLGALEELEKTARAEKKPERETRKGWLMSKSRKGRRPVSVGKLLKKEKEGTLGGYKLAEVLGAFNKIASQNIIGYSTANDPGEARPQPKPGDVPSRDDVGGAIPKREDGRGNATTIQTTAVHLNDIASTEKAT